MPALLLDGSSARTRCRTISERSRRIAGADPDERYPYFHGATAGKSRMTLSAVLLAGGESTRMGRDKATLEWRGLPLWACQLEKLRALTPNIFVSTRFAVPWRPADVKLVIDESPSRGPLSGLTASLARIQTDCLLVLAVDMPFITLSHLKKVCHWARPGVGAVPVVNGKVEPLAAVYPKRAGSICAEVLSGTDHSLQQLVRQLAMLELVRKIPIAGAAGRFYQSLNYPADLQP
jgi:molybdenum cofactor guanylyltransferase